MSKEKPPRFFNRELSWIEFNARVLAEACRKNVPLLERLKFLTIVTSNFDEFFMVRVAGLKHQMRSDPERRDISGMTSKEQLQKISDRVHELIQIQYSCLNNEIIPGLAKEGIVYVPPEKYTGKQALYADSLFQNEIFPLLTPLRTDDEEDFPHIANLRLHAAFLLKQMFDIPLLTQTVSGENGNASEADGENESSLPLAVVQIPTSIKRIIWLPSDEGTRAFTLLDDIVRMFGTRLFPGYTVEETLLFKVTRDADFSVDEERDNDFIEAMEEVLVNRQSSVPVRLASNSESETIRHILERKLNLAPEDVYQIKGIMDLATLTDLISVEGCDKLRYPQWKNFWPPSIPHDVELWNEMKHTDAILHVPYESYEPVLRFISEAADDPGVLAIKITLYRTSGNSPIISALERAARNGKQVTAFVELKARFDEKQNISWAERLEKAGVIVVHGIARLKVHAKILLVVRREQTGIYRYVHLSTGNYNEKTARFYGDLSLFTCNQEIANDATVFFNMISGYSAIQTMKRLVMAPITLKSQLLSLIERESRRSTPDTPGLIMAKMNSLGHGEMIEALYQASCADVRILLNVRGICMLVPGVPGQSKNISVVSIIDRFLEHARIFYFQNGGSEEIYLSSADWMPRNLDRRVELMFPVLQEDLFRRIKDILSVYFSDNAKSHYLQSSGTWIARRVLDPEPEVRAQEYLYTQAKTQAEAQNTEIPREFIVRRNEK